MQMNNKQKTIPTMGTKIHRNQSVTSSQDSDKTSNDEHTSDPDEFDAFSSTTLVDFTKLEEQDTPQLRAIHREFDEMIAKTRSTRKASTASESVDLAHKKDENCAKKAPRRIPTMKMSKTKLDASTTSSKSSPVIKSTANDRRVMPKRPTMNGQPTTQQRPTMEPRDELNRLRNEADQSQQSTSLSISKTKLQPAVIAKHKEIVQLTNELATVKSQLTEAQHQLQIHQQNETDLRAELHSSFHPKFDLLENEHRNTIQIVDNQQTKIQELLQDNQHLQEELRLYDIDLRELVDENSQMTKELRRTQSKIEQLELARLQDLEGLKGENIRLLAMVDQLNHASQLPRDTDQAQVESYEAQIQELLQDNQHLQEELRLYDIDLRELVDENSQMTKELRRTQSKIEQLELARLQDLEGLKGENIRLLAMVDQLNHASQLPRDTDQAQVESYEAQIQELLQDNQHLQEELRLYDIDLRELVDENSQMTKELRRTQSKIEQLELARLQDLEGLKGENIRLLAMVDQLNHASQLPRDTDQAQVESYEAQIQELLQDNQHLQEELRLYDIDLRELVDENSQMTKELRRTQSKIEQLELARLQDLEGLKGENIRLLAMVDQLNHASQLPRDTDQAQVESYEAQIQELVDENSQMTKELRRTQSKIEQLELARLQDLEGLKGENIRLLAMVDQLNHASQLPRDTDQAQVESYEAQIQELLQDNQHLQEELRLYDIDLRELVDENSQMTKELRRTQSKIEQLELARLQDLEGLKGENIRLLAMVDQLNHASQLPRDTDQAQVESYEAQIQELLQDNQHLQEELRLYDIDLRELVDENSQMTKELRRTQSKIEQLELARLQDLEGLKGENIRLLAMVDQLNHASQLPRDTDQAQVESYEAQIQELVDENSQMTKELRRTQSKIEQLELARLQDLEGLKGENIRLLAMVDQLNHASQLPRDTDQAQVESYEAQIQELLQDNQHLQEELRLYDIDLRELVDENSQMTKELRRTQSKIEQLELARLQDLEGLKGENIRLLAMVDQLNHASQLPRDTDQAQVESYEAQIQELVDENSQMTKELRRTQSKIEQLELARLQDLEGLKGENIRLLAMVDQLNHASQLPRDTDQAQVESYEAQIQELLQDNQHLQEELRLYDIDLRELVDENSQMTKELRRTQSKIEQLELARLQDLEGLKGENIRLLAMVDQLNHASQLPRDTDQAQVESYEAQIQELLQDNQHLQEELRLYDIDLRELVDENSQMTKELRRTQSKIEQLELARLQDLEGLKGENIRLLAMVDQLNHASQLPRDTDQAQVESYEAQIQELLQDNQHLQEELRLYDIDLRELVDENSQMTKELRRTQSKIEQLELARLQDLEGLKGENIRLLAMVDQLNHASQLPRDTDQAQVESYEAQIQELLQDNQHLQEELRLYDIDLRELVDENSQMTKELRRTQSKIEQLELARLQDLEGLKGENIRLLAMVDQLNHASQLPRDTDQAQVESYEAQIQELLQDNQHLQEELHLYDIDLRELVDENSQMTKELRRTQSKIEQLELARLQDLEGLKGENIRLLAMVDQLNHASQLPRDTDQAQVESYEAQIQELVDENSQMTKELRRTQSKIEQLELARLQDLEGLKGENIRLLAMVDQLNHASQLPRDTDQAQVESYEAQIQELLQDNQHLQEELRLYDIDLRELVDENSQMTKELRRTQSKIEQLELARLQDLEGLKGENIRLLAMVDQLNHASQLPRDTDQAQVESYEAQIQELLQDNQHLQEELRLYDIDLRELVDENSQMTKELRRTQSKIEQLELARLQDLEGLKGENIRLLAMVDQLNHASQLPRDTDQAQVESYEAQIQELLQDNQHLQEELRLYDIDLRELVDENSQMTKELRRTQSKIEQLELARLQDLEGLKGENIRLLAMVDQLNHASQLPRDTDQAQVESYEAQIQELLQDNQHLQEELRLYDIDLRELVDENSQMTKELRRTQSKIEQLELARLQDLEGLKGENIRLLAMVDQLNHASQLPRDTDQAQVESYEAQIQELLQDNQHLQEELRLYDIDLRELVDENSQMTKELRRTQSKIEQLELARLQDLEGLKGENIRLLAMVDQLNHASQLPRDTDQAQVESYEAQIQELLQDNQHLQEELRLYDIDLRELVDENSQMTKELRRTQSKIEQLELARLQDLEGLKGENIRLLAMVDQLNHASQLPRDTDQAQVESYEAQIQELLQDNQHLQEELRLYDIDLRELVDENSQMTKELRRTQSKIEQLELARLQDLEGLKGENIRLLAMVDQLNHASQLPRDTDQAQVESYEAQIQELLQDNQHLQEELRLYDIDLRELVDENSQMTKELRRTQSKIEQLELARLQDLEGLKGENIRLLAMVDQLNHASQLPRDTDQAQVESYEAQIQELLQDNQHLQEELRLYDIDLRELVDENSQMTKELRRTQSKIEQLELARLQDLEGLKGENIRLLAMVDQLNHASQLPRDTDQAQVESYEAQIQELLQDNQHLQEELRLYDIDLRELVDENSQMTKELRRTQSKIEQLELARLQDLEGLKGENIRLLAMVDQLNHASQLPRDTDQAQVESYEAQIQELLQDNQHLQEELRLYDIDLRELVDENSQMTKELRRTQSKIEQLELARLQDLEGLKGENIRLLAMVDQLNHASQLPRDTDQAQVESYEAQIQELLQDNQHLQEELRLYDIDLRELVDENSQMTKELRRTQSKIEQLELARLQDLEGLKGENIRLLAMVDQLNHASQLPRDTDQAQVESYEAQIQELLQDNQHLQEELRLYDIDLRELVDENSQMTKELRRTQSKIEQLELARLQDLEGLKGENIRLLAMVDQLNHASQLPRDTDQAQVESYEAQIQELLQDNQHLQEELRLYDIDLRELVDENSQMTKELRRTQSKIEQLELARLQDLEGLKGENIRLLAMVDQLNHASQLPRDTDQAQVESYEAQIQELLQDNQHLQEELRLYDIDLRELVDENSQMTKELRRTQSKIEQLELARLQDLEGLKGENIRLLAMVDQLNHASQLPRDTDQAQVESYEAQIQELVDENSQMTKELRRTQSKIEQLELARLQDLEGLKGENIRLLAMVDQLNHASQLPRDTDQAQVESYEAQIQELLQDNQHLQEELRLYDIDLRELVDENSQMTKELRRTQSKIEQLELARLQDLEGLKGENIRLLAMVDQLNHASQLPRDTDQAQVESYEAQIQELLQDNQHLQEELRLYDIDLRELVDENSQMTKELRRTQSKIEQLELARLQDLEGLKGENIRLLAMVDQLNHASQLPRDTDQAQVESYEAQIQELLQDNQHLQEELRLYDIDLRELVDENSQMTKELRRTQSKIEQLELARLQDLEGLKGENIRLLAMVDQLNHASQLPRDTDQAQVESYEAQIQELVDENSQMTKELRRTQSKIEQLELARLQDLEGLKGENIRLLAMVDQLNHASQLPRDTDQAQVESYEAQIQELLQDNQHLQEELRLYDIDLRELVDENSQMTKELRRTQSKIEQLELARLQDLEGLKGENIRLLAMVDQLNHASQLPRDTDQAQVESYEAQIQELLQDNQHLQEELRLYDIDLRELVDENSQMTKELRRTQSKIEQLELARLQDLEGLKGENIRLLAMVDQLNHASQLPRDTDQAQVESYEAQIQELLQDNQHLQEELRLYDIDLRELVDENSQMTKELRRTQSKIEQLELARLQDLEGLKGENIRLLAMVDQLNHASQLPRDTDQAQVESYEAQIQELLQDNQHLQEELRLYDIDLRELVDENSQMTKELRRTQSKIEQLELARLQDLEGLKGENIRLLAMVDQLNHASQLPRDTDQAQVESYEAQIQELLQDNQHLQEELRLYDIDLRELVDENSQMTKELRRTQSKIEQLELARLQDLEGLKGENIRLLAMVDQLNHASQLPRDTDQAQVESYEAQIQELLQDNQHLQEELRLYDIDLRELVDENSQMTKELRRTQSKIEQLELARLQDLEGLKGENIRLLAMVDQLNHASQLPRDTDQAQVESYEAQIQELLQDNQHLQEELRLYDIDLRELVDENSQMTKELRRTQSKIEQLELARLQDLEGLKGENIRLLAMVDQLNHASQLPRDTDQAQVESYEAQIQELLQDNQHLQEELRLYDIDLRELVDENSQMTKELRRTQSKIEQLELARLQDLEGLKGENIRLLAMVDQLNHASQLPRDTDQAQVESYEAQIQELLQDNQHLQEELRLYDIDLRELVDENSQMTKELRRTQSKIEQLELARLQDLEGLKGENIRLLAMVDQLNHASQLPRDTDQAQVESYEAQIQELLQDNQHLQEELRLYDIDLRELVDENSQMTKELRRTQSKIEQLELARLQDLEGLKGENIRLLAMVDQLNHASQLPRDTDQAQVESYEAQIQELLQDNQHLQEELRLYDIDLRELVDENSQMTKELRRTQSKIEQLELARLQDLEGLKGENIRLLAMVDQLNHASQLPRDTDQAQVESYEAQIQELLQDNQHLQEELRLYDIDLRELVDENSQMTKELRRTQSKIEQLELARLQDLEGLKGENIRLLAMVDQLNHASQLPRDTDQAQVESYEAQIQELLQDNQHLQEELRLYDIDLRELVDENSQMTKELRRTQSKIEQLELARLQDLEGLKGENIRLLAMVDQLNHASQLPRDTDQAQVESYEAQIQELLQDNQHLQEELRLYDIDLRELVDENSQMTKELRRTQSKIEQLELARLQDLEGLKGENIRLLAMVDQLNHASQLPRDTDQAQVESYEAQIQELLQDNQHLQEELRLYDIDLRELVDENSQMTKELRRTQSKIEQLELARLQDLEGLKGENIRLLAMVDQLNHASQLPRDTDQAQVESYEAQIQELLQDNQHLQEELRLYDIDLRELVDENSQMTKELRRTQSKIEQLELARLQDLEGLKGENIRLLAMVDQLNHASQLPRDTDQAQVESYEAQIQELLQDNQHLQEELRLYDIDLRELVDENSQVTKELRRTQSKIEQLELARLQDLEGLKGENIRLLAMVDQLNHASQLPRDTDQAQVESYEAQIQELLQDNQHLQEELRLYDIDLRELVDENSQMTKELRRTQSKIEQLELARLQDLEGLKGENIRLLAMVDQLNHASQLPRDTDQAQVESYEAQIQELLQDNQHLQEELRLYDIDLRELVDENSQMTKELRRTQSKIEQLELARLQDLEGLKGENIRLLAMVDQLNHASQLPRDTDQAQVESYEAQIQELVDENSQMTKELRRTQSKIEQLELARLQDLEGLKGENIRLLAMVDQLNHASQLPRDTDQAQVESYEAQIQELLQDNQHLQEGLRLYDIDLRELVDENSQMTKELRRTQSKIEQLELARLQDLEGLKGENIRLLAMVDQLNHASQLPRDTDQAQVESYEAQIQELLQDNQHLQEELRLYDIDLRELVDENSQMTKELRRTQSKIEQLELARLQDLEGLKGENIRLLAMVDQLNHASQLPRDTDQAQVESYEAQIQEVRPVHTKNMDLIAWRSSFKTI
ncbi:hypothetical protein AC1031_013232 [Aphanomyces cochlioides]|nr:hypothetical protein AC1031_013232 [Aphanomyces cochlioides]